MPERRLDAALDDIAADYAEPVPAVGEGRPSSTPALGKRVTISVDAATWRRFVRQTARDSDVGYASRALHRLMTAYLQGDADAQAIARQARRAAERH